jgi:hypothetical protein
MGMTGLLTRSAKALRARELRADGGASRGNKSRAFELNSSALPWERQGAEDEGASCRKGLPWERQGAAGGGASRGRGAGGCGGVTK